MKAYYEARAHEYDDRWLGERLYADRDRPRWENADGLPLPFPDRAFERVFTSHFYGHLEEDDRTRFLAEARRVAAELVVVDASRAHATADVEHQSRVLNDGSRWQVYKRWFTPETLAVELGGRTETLSRHWFVAVTAR